MDKEALRKQFRSIRQQLPDSVQQDHANAVFDLFTQSEFTKAEHVALYLPNDGELNIRPIIEWLWENGKNVYLPLLENRTLGFALYQKESPLVENKFHIKEPSNEFVVDPEQLDLIMLPVVAFDQRGYRLGRGGGYYDETCRPIKDHAKPVLLGVAHSEQYIETLPNTPQDVTMDALITNEKIWSFPNDELLVNEV